MSAKLEGQISSKKLKSVKEGEVISRKKRKKGEGVHVISSIQRQNTRAGQVLSSNKRKNVNGKELIPGKKRKKVKGNEVILGKERNNSNGTTVISEKTIKVVEGDKVITQHVFFRKTDRRRPKVSFPDLHNFALLGNKPAFVRACLIAYSKGKETIRKEINYIEVPRTGGLLPIHCALHKNHTDIALFILRQRKALGANVLLTGGERKWNVFHYLSAIPGCHDRKDIAEALDLLLRAKGSKKGIVRSITERDVQGYNSIMLTIVWKSFDVLSRLVAFLLSCKDNEAIFKNVIYSSVDEIAGNNMFHLCAREGSVKLVKYLLDTVKETLGMAVLLDVMQQRRKLDNRVPGEVAERFSNHEIRRMFDAVIGT